MFISGLGFLSVQQSRSFMKCPSPSSHKCQFNGQVKLNKEQLHKNTVVWRTMGVYLGRWLHGVGGSCCEELNSWNYGQRPVIE